MANNSQSSGGAVDGLKRTIGDVIDREVESLRQEQSRAVMPLIGPLLDAWEGVPNDVKSQMEEEALDLCHYLRRIERAMDGE